MVMLHIKLIRMKCTATYKQRIALILTPNPLGGVKTGFFFLKMVMLHIKLKGTMQAIILSLHIFHVAFQIKGNETYDNMQANILPLHTPWNLEWG